MEEHSNLLSNVNPKNIDIYKAGYIEKYTYMCIIQFYWKHKVESEEEENMEGFGETNGTCYELISKIKQIIAFTI